MKIRTAFLLLFALAGICASRQAVADDPARAAAELDCMSSESSTPFFWTRERKSFQAAWSHIPFCEVTKSDASFVRSSNGAAPVVAMEVSFDEDLPPNIGARSGLLLKSLP
jgi:hypothetical protein